MDEMTGHQSAAALANSGMWEEVNGENPPMMEDGDLIWRGAGWCANPVALAQAAVDEIIRLTRERDEARTRIREFEEALRALRDADRALVIVSKQKTTAADTPYWRTRYAAYTRYWRARCAAYALIGPTSATDGDSDAQEDR